jgi:hypothetical protein
LVQAKAIAITVIVKGFTAAMKHEVGRRLLLPFLPAPGEGPSETAIANGWMRYEVIGKTDNGKNPPLCLCRGPENASRLGWA